MSFIALRCAQLVLRLYKRVVSPVLHAFTLLLMGPGFGCRHVPTCSEYAESAMEKHGLIRGGRMAAKRLLRCHPWGTTGEDPA